MSERVMLGEELSNSTGQELMIKLSYSEEIGPVTRNNLDTFLKTAQGLESLRNVQCTVGARIVEKVTDSTKPSDQTDSASVAVRGVCADSSIAVNSELEVTRYYCQTAPSFIAAHAKGGDTKWTPTVLIELFFTYDPKSKRDDIAKELRTAVQQSVLLNYNGGTDKDVTIRIISFLLAKE